LKPLVSFIPAALTIAAVMRSGKRVSITLPVDDNGMPRNWRLPMIEVLEGFPANVAAFACHGHVTRKDYDSVLVPVVEAALERHDKLRLYYETASDFDGIDPGAVLEDTMVGISHALRWEKMAVVTDIGWIRHSILLFRFLLPGELRVFPSAEAAEAKEWIVA
jgi:hypothetical protein